MTKIIGPSEFVAYTHSDFLEYQTASERTVGMRRAIANVAKATGEYSEESVRFGIAISDGVGIERDSRINHQNRLRFSLRTVGIDFPLPASLDTAVTDSFVNFSTISDKLTNDNWRVLKFFGGKGLAAEHGQVEQYGSWLGVEQLDATAATLGDPDFVATLGIELEKVYDHDGEGKIDYEYRVVNSDEQFITIERMRPTRDYSNGIHSIKSSLFTLDTSKLSGRQRGMLSDVLNGHTKKRKDERMQFGEEIVEPLILDPALRNSDVKLFPTSAIHFSLRRHTEE